MSWRQRRASWTRRGAALLRAAPLVAILCVACEALDRAGPAVSEGTTGAVSGQLGVFYGGQVQELRRVPWPTEGKRPHLGFRVRFEEATREALPLRWEIDMPAGRAPTGRVQRVNEATVPAGQSVLDQSLDVPPNAELGVWNVRVLVGQKLVIDRALHLYAP